MAVTRDIVRYIIGTRFDDIPQNVVTRTKQFIMDEIGNALGGSAVPSGKIIIEWAKQMKGQPESTIFFDGLKVPVGIASGINTQLCMGLELMETYKNKSHPGSGMVMTALAFGERNKLSGKDIITAVSTAYDVTGRIIDATFPSPEHKQKVWNESWQGCGPLVVALKLMSLNEEEGMNAFGMGLGYAPTMNVHNILYVPGSMSKLGNQFHNFVAINAVILAKLGYTGFFEILDEPYPYWTTISDTNDWETYTKNLGTDFLITSAMAFKPWPTCRWAQPGIQSLLEIMSAERLKPYDIEEVTFHAHDKITSYPYDNTNPSNPEDAYWSVPWAFANAALGYQIGPEWYLEERFSDSEMLSFMRKVKIKALPEAIEAFAKEPEKSITLLEVKTKQGKTHSERTDYCKGDPQQPMSDKEVVSKFRSQTTNVIPNDKAEQIIHLVKRLEELSDISEIMKLVF